MHMRKSDVKLTGETLSIRRKLMSVASDNAVNPSLTLAAPAGSVFCFNLKSLESPLHYGFSLVFISFYFVL